MRKEDELFGIAAKLGKEHSAEVKAGTSKLMSNILTHGMLPKDALGIKDGQAEAMYAHAYQLYNNGKYADAQRIFTTLILLNVLEPKYLLGAAACAHMLGDLEHAANLYIKCGMFSDKDPVPYYHAADCYIQMKDPLSAIVALTMVIKKAGEKVEFSTLKDRAKIMIVTLEKELKEKEVKTNLNEK